MVYFTVSGVNEVNSAEAIGPFSPYRLPALVVRKADATIRSLIALVVGVAPGSRRVRPLSGPGSDTLIVLELSELDFAPFALGRSMGMRTATATRASTAPRPSDPRRTIPLLARTS